MVTARGRPSGMATTTTEMAMMRVSIRSVQSLFLRVKVRSYGMQSGSATHTVTFWHPHGSPPNISMMTLTIKEQRVATAHAIPT